MNIPPKWMDRIRLAVPFVSLSMGIWSAFFVVRHYEQARRVAWLLGAAWTALGVLALLRRKARPDDSIWKKRAEFAVALAGQSAAQEILFFVLPFWIRSTTWTSRNGPFTAFLILLALTVAIDSIYRRILRSIRLAAFHKSLVQFAALGFLLPVFFGTHTLAALALAGGLAGGIAVLAARLRRPVPSVILGTFLGATLAASMAPWIAPVPLRLETPVFASGITNREPTDTLHRAPRGIELVAFTPVFAPSGFTDTLYHLWSRDGRELSRIRLDLHGGRKAGFRTWSTSKLATAQSGEVQVDVVNSADQTVGRMTIEVGR